MTVTNGTPKNSWTTNHSEAVAAKTTTSPFAQIFAIMISAGLTGMTSKCSTVTCSRSRSNAAPTRTIASKVTF